MPKVLGNYAVHVASDDYEVTVDYDTMEKGELPTLHNKVGTGSVMITLSYPFEKGHTFMVFRDGRELEVKDLIDDIRKGFRYMYGVSVDQGNAGTLLNRIHEGDFGVAYHDIRDLWIEDLTTDGTTIEVSIGS